MKTCSVCGQKKRKSAFPKDSRSKDGLHAICKECKASKKDISKKMAMKKQKNYTEKQETKKCSGCGMHKPVTEFSKDRTKKDGLYHLCKACRSMYRRKKKQSKDKNTSQKKAAVPKKGKTEQNHPIGTTDKVSGQDAYYTCCVCGEGLVGYIPGYLHGQPVCKDCIIINLKEIFKAKH